MSQEQDLAALAQLKSGETKGLEVLVQQHYQALFSISYRYVLQREVAEELAQDVFLALWEKRESLMISGNVKAYLQTAIKNRSLNYLKTKYAQQGFVDMPEMAIYPPEGDPNELALLLKQAIEQLPEKCAIIFKMSRFAEMTYEEIAQELGISKETVKSQIKTALSKIRAFIGERWDGVLPLWLMILLFQ